ncbi:MAG: recombinase family protein [Alphaproteobacteria bacterium]|nr:recombinase family protein [Rickettsiales bacterium]
MSSQAKPEGCSFDTQTHRLREYCKRKEFDIIKEFQLVKSATTKGGKFFIKMTNFIKKQREPIALICDTVDRLERSFKEVLILEDLRIKGKLILHFLREGQVLDKKANSAQLMAYQMFVMMATNFANSISDNVKRGFDGKRRRGESLGHVLIVYLTQNGEVSMDPFKSILIRELLHDYSTGLYSCPQLAKTYSRKV